MSTGFKYNENTEVPFVVKIKKREFGTVKKCLFKFDPVKFICNNEIGFVISIPCF